MVLFKINYYKGIYNEATESFTSGLFSSNLLTKLIVSCYINYFLILALIFESNVLPDSNCLNYSLTQPLIFSVNITANPL